MGRIAVRIIANIVILFGLFLLGRVLCNSFRGAAARQYFGTPPETWIENAYALGLGLPVALHIISIGLILQRDWLSAAGAKWAKGAVVVSGCWLGLALAIRWLIL